jgi:hypothetical protein
MVKNGQATCLSCGQTLYAVPSNVGPRTMPDYQSLFNQGIYSLGNLAHCRGMSCTLMAQPSPGLG